MKLNKIVCTLAAVALSSMVFAGNSSPMQVAVNNYSSNQAVAQEEEITYEKMLDAFFGAVQEMLPAKTQQDTDTDKAVKAGFLKLFKDDEANALNENEQAIIATFFQDIPAVSEEVNTLAQNKDLTLRQLEEKQAQIAAKINALFGSAAEKLVKNQTEVKASNVNTERATQITALFYTQLVGAAALAEMSAGAE